MNMPEGYERLKKFYSSEENINHFNDFKTAMSLLKEMAEALQCVYDNTGCYIEVNQSLKKFKEWI